MESERYRLSFSRDHQGGSEREDLEKERSQAETLRYIEATISALTGGCEICIHSAGPYCKKHQRPVRAGDPRCEEFARRFPEDPEEAARAQARKIVTDTLGVSTRYAGRLV
jgi:hypothetical protein